MGKLDKGRCGLCCSLVVRIDEKDKERIRKLGHKDEFFVESAANNTQALRRINGYCRFVKIEDGIATCTIYDHRPRICREYVCVPEGEDDCKLKRHYNIVGLID